MMGLSRYRVVAGGFILLIVAVGLFFWSVTKKEPQPAVPEVVSGWQSTTQNGFTFQYPADFGTEYLKAFDWPPKVQVEAGPYTCAPAGSSSGRAGVTTEKTIGLHKYCVTEVVEGAAGSTYTQYAYAVEKGDKVIIFTFTTRYPQCGNYESPEKERCESELSNFNLDALVDKIFSTLHTPL